MILAIDIGNTTVGVYGVRRGTEDHEIVFGGRFPTAEKEIIPALKRILARAGVSAGDFEGAAVSSVVPHLNDPFFGAVVRLLGRSPVFLEAKLVTGLRFAVPEPERLGADRLADSLWAAKRYPLPLITADLGTATTFNVIGEGGVFLGGLISAGVETASAALSARAAQLPNGELTAPERLIGRNTEECMRAGAVFGAAAMIDGIAARVEAELGKETALILTGGWAELVEPFCLRPHEYEPFLLPKGLAVFYDSLGEKKN